MYPRIIKYSSAMKIFTNKLTIIITKIKTAFSIEMIFIITVNLSAIAFFCIT